jgi:hypothetical protein
VWFEEIAAQLIFERDARREGVAFERGARTNPLGLTYRFSIDVPVHDDERVVTAVFDTAQEPRVWIDGPVCRRHRFLNNALCMWLRSDPPENRWVPEDGLLALIGHIKLHAYCEAECRAGNCWPKPEAPGAHPRPENCPSC